MGQPPVTDAAGVAGLFAPETIAKRMGIAGAAVSMKNDPSGLNITTNVLGLFRGFEGPMAITGAFNDLFEYKMHQDTPSDKSMVIPPNCF